MHYCPRQPRPLACRGVTWTRLKNTDLEKTRAMSDFNPTTRVFAAGMKNGPKPNIVFGVHMAAGITEENLKDIQERFTYRDDDLFIATPAKCGTTWLQHIVKLIRNNGVDNGVDSDVAIPWFELMTVEEIEVRKESIAIINKAISIRPMHRP